jgi:hypothetical protein
MDNEPGQLRDHRARQEELRRANGPLWEPGDLIFCTDRGRPLNWRNVTREYKRFLGRAGLPDVRFHDLRHSNATILAAAGVPLKVIQERLGHSDPRTTLAFYGHVTPAMGKEAAQKLGELLHGEEGSKRRGEMVVKMVVNAPRRLFPPGLIASFFVALLRISGGALGRIRTHNPLVRRRGIAVPPRPATSRHPPPRREIPA